MPNTPQPLAPVGGTTPEIRVRDRLFRVSNGRLQVKHDTVSDWMTMSWTIEDVRAMLALFTLTSAQSRD